MEKFLKTFFGTAERTVVSVVVGVVFLWMVVPGTIGNVRVAFNENQAASSNLALSMDTPRIKAQCYGGKNPRIFVTWNSPTERIQKRTDRGKWTFLQNAERKSYFADWDIARGHTYTYRLRNAAGKTMDTARIQTSEAACTTTPVASIMDLTHANGYYVGDTVSVSVIGEPKRPVELCYRFTMAASPYFIEESCNQAIGKTDEHGQFETSYQLTSGHLGTWKQWFVVANQNSNEMSYAVASLVTPTPTPTLVCPQPTPPSDCPNAVPRYNPNGDGCIIGYLCGDTTPTPTVLPGPAVTVRSPNGGESFDLFGQQFIPISWQRNWMPSGANGTVDILYQIPGMPARIIARGISDKVTYQWDIHNMPVGYKYKIVVTSRGFGGSDISPLSDESDNTFSIVNAEQTPTPPPGSISAAQAPSNPRNHAAYWGQTSDIAGAWRFSSTGEGFFIEKLGFANISSDVKTITVQAKDQSGNIITTSQPIPVGGNPVFTFDGTARPFVPKDSSLEIVLAAEYKTRQEWPSFKATFNPVMSTATFRAVGEGSGNVLASFGGKDIPGANIRIYPVFPLLKNISLPHKKLTTTDPLLIFTIGAQGLPDSRLVFTNDTWSKGYLVFDIATDGKPGTMQFTLYDENGIVYDQAYNQQGKVTFDFSHATAEILGGTTKTFRVTADNLGGATYAQFTLPDEAGRISWSDWSGAGYVSELGYLYFLPIYGSYLTINF